MPESSPDAAPSETSLRRRFLVWGGSIVGVLAVLVLAAALVLPRLFTSEQLKGYVIPPLEEATGRQVEIDAIGLRILPAPAIRVSGFRLANAEGYGPAPAVEARALNVDVALWPLFFATIRPTAVGLERPVIRYEVAEDGATNFDDLGEEADTTREEGPLLGGIPLSNVRVTEAQLHYADRSANQVLRLDFDAQLGVVPERSALTSDGTVDLRAVRALLPSVGPDTLMVRDARATYDVRVAPSTGTVDLRTLRLETAPLTLLLQGTLSGLHEQPTVDLTFETGATDLTEIAAFVPAAAIEGLNPRGTLDLKGTITGPFSGEADTTTALSVNASGRLSGAGVDYQGTALLRELRGDLSLSLDDVALRSMEGQLLGASLAGSAAVQQLQGDPQIDLDLQTGAMNLSDLVAFVPPEQVGDYNPQGRLRLDATAKGPMPTDAASLETLVVEGTGQLAEFGMDYEGRGLLRDVSSDLAFSSDAIAARSLKGQLLGASLAGSAAVRQFRTEPQIDLDLQTGMMNLSDLVAFVPPEQVGDYNPQGRLRLDATATGPLPTDATSLKTLAVNGTGQLAEFGMDYEGRGLLRDVSADLTFSSDAVAARSLKGQLLGASLAGSAAVRQFRTEPQIDLDLQTGMMNLSDLVAFVPPEQVGDYNPQGRLRLDATATGPMPEDAASLKKLAVNGTGQLASFGMDYGGQALLRSLKADLSFSGTTARAQGIDGQLLGKPLSGTLTMREWRGTPQVEGQLAGTADVAQLLALRDDESSPSVQATAEYDVSFVGPLQTPDAIRPSGRVRLTKVQVPYESFRHPIEIADVTVQLTGTGLSTDQFTVRSGQQTVALRTTMQNLFPISKGLAESSPTLSASFTLTANRLDLDALYPEGQTSDGVHYSDLFAAQLAGSKVGGQSPEVLADELYGDIDLPAYTVDGRIEIGTLLNEPQRFENLALDLQMKGRRLTVRNLRASTYGGALSGSLTLDQSGSAASDAAPTSPVVRFASTETGRAGSSVGPAMPQSDLTYDVQLRNADAGTVLQDWTSLGRLVTGTLTLTADGESRLTEGFLPQTNALSAIGESVVTDGELGLNLGPAAVLVDALGLPGTSFKNFRRLGGPFVIKDGQFQVETWPFEADQFDGTIKGNFGLGGSLNLDMTLNLPVELIETSRIGSRLGGGDGQLGAVLKKLLGTPAADETIPVTLRIRGTMQDPSVQVINQDAIESRIESLAKEAGLNILRDLFGGGGGEEN